MASHIRRDIISCSTYFFFICSCYIIIQEVIVHSWNGRICTSRLILAILCSLACWGYTCSQKEQIWDASWARDNTHKHMEKTDLGKPSRWYSLGLSYELIHYQLQDISRALILFPCPLHFPDKTLRLWKESCYFHGTNHPWCTDFLKFTCWCHHLWMDTTVGAVHLNGSQFW